MKRGFLHLASLVFYLCSGLPAANEIGLKLLPKGRPFRLAFADPREIRMALLYEGNSRIDAVVGNYFSLFAVQPAEPTDWAVHLGLEGAGYFSLRQVDQRFPLEAADGQLGVYVEGKSGSWQGQIRYTHLSAHLADGSSGTSIPFSREFFSFRLGYLIRNDIHLYAGMYLITNSVPEVPPLWFQSGGSFFSPWGLGNLAPFVAMDFKWKRESEYNPTFNLQLGLALNNPPEAYRSFRFFYAYATGADPRGQFYDRQSTSHSVGIEMQI